MSLLCKIIFEFKKKTSKGTAKEMITFWECKHHAIVTTQPQFFEDI